MFVQCVERVSLCTPERSLPSVQFRLQRNIAHASEVRVAPSAWVSVVENGSPRCLRSFGALLSRFWCLGYIFGALGFPLWASPSALHASPWVTGCTEQQRVLSHFWSLMFGAWPVCRWLMVTDWSVDGWRLIS